jgi:hypothetical protein
MAPAERAELDRHEAEAAMAFRIRRCACGAPAVSVEPGSAPVREAGFLLRPAVPDRNFCLDHAMPARRAAV